MRYAAWPTLPHVAHERSVWNRSYYLGKARIAWRAADVFENQPNTHPCIQLYKVQGLEKICDFVVDKVVHLDGSESVLQRRPRVRCLSSSRALEL